MHFKRPRAKSGRGPVILTVKEGLTMIWLHGTVMVLAGLVAAGDTPAKPGLTIGPGGVVLRAGKPYRGIGINFFSAFSRMMLDRNDVSYRDGFKELAQRNIPFIRFMCGGFWPKDWALYREDPTEYFRRLDQFVHDAERAGIGLIPSLCWYSSCIPDLVGEPRSAWGNPDSKTIAFMREYVTRVVSRYLRSRGVWAWELGNEYSLEADLPNAAEHRPPVHVSLGTAAARSEADDMTHDMIATACREFGKAVRAVDTWRPITSGHSLPRSAAEHLRQSHSWEPDSPEAFRKNLIDINPEPINLVSVHLYAFDKEKRFGRDHVPYADVMRECMQAVAAAGKALFVGEFGAADDPKNPNPEKMRAEVEEMFAAFESTGVPLAAIWNYDLPEQEDSINITPTNKRAYLLDAIHDANKRLSGE